MCASFRLHSAVSAIRTFSAHNQADIIAGNGADSTNSNLSMRHLKCGRISAVHSKIDSFVSILRVDQVRLGSPCRLKMAYWHLGAVWSSPVPNSRGQVVCGKLTGSRPSSTALSVPTAPSHMAPPITRQWVQGRTADHAGTRDAATIASPPPNPSPQVIKRAGSVDDRPMAVGQRQGVQISVLEIMPPNHAANRPRRFGFPGLLRRIPGLKRVMVPASNPRPRSWNMSTVGRPLPRRADVSARISAVGGRDGPLLIGRLSIFGKAGAPPGPPRRAALAIGRHTASKSVGISVMP